MTSTPTPDNLLPVSQPRSSPRSPPRTGSMPAPISPPKTSTSTSTLASTNSNSSQGLSAFSSSTSIGSNDHRTPNVYINGLPPNFPEDQLYAMTKEFGPVISVRTFTRHVSDRPSGYGFVLFESCDAAEACVESLRRFRNLHPSFSKQVHKIPGTVYANVPAAPASTTDSSGTETFKARMERLKDHSSTNLYVEGLPLSIDEATLGALVAPYAIKSSRFFQTRLSHPPRIIAFVRLESRQACEEVIERLHGRMVRGWNDSGSRISVRFADSSEQRDLRRNERSNRDGGDASNARLTMAQAALLSLRGQQTQLSPPAPAPPGIPPPIGLGRERGPPRPGNAERAQLPVHPLTAAYSEQQLSPSLDLGVAARQDAEAKAASLLALEQHLLLQAQIDARRQALADLRLSADPMATPTAASTRPLDRNAALASKEFVPRGLGARQPSPAQQQQQMADSVLYDSRTQTRDPRARASTLPPQLMHGEAPRGGAPLSVAVPQGTPSPRAEDSVPSPALTYNSSASSAALSPATPFFGSFAQGAEYGYGHGGQQAKGEDATLVKYARRGSSAGIDGNAQTAQ